MDTLAESSMLRSFAFSENEFEKQMLGVVFSSTYYQNINICKFLF
jgi:hypothetical protein